MHIIGPNFQKTEAKTEAKGNTKLLLERCHNLQGIEGSYHQVQSLIQVVLRLHPALQNLNQVPSPIQHHDQDHQHLKHINRILHLNLTDHNLTPQVLVCSHQDLHRGRVHIHRNQFKGRNLQHQRRT